MEITAALTKIKDAMRIRHDALDATLTDDIDAAALELKRSGVAVYDADGSIKDDALILTAIRYHVMAAEDYAGKAPQYTNAYEKLRDTLAMSGEYRAETDNEG